MPPPMSGTRLILLLGVICAIAPLSIDMYLPVFPIIADELGVPVATVQLSLSAFFIGLAVGQLLWGPIADRFGRRRPLVAGMLLYTVASAGCALAPDANTLIALRTLQALGGCAGMVIALTIVRDVYDPQEGARVMSRLWLVFGLAPILAPSLGAWVVLFASWRSIFWILTGVGVLCLVATVALLPETRPAAARGALPPAALRHDYAALLGDRRFVGFAVAVACCHATVLAYVTASPFVLITVYGLEPSRYAVLFGITAAALVASAQWNAHLLRRHAPAALLRRASLLPPPLAMALVGLAWQQLGGITALVAMLLVYMSVTALIRPNATACALAGHGDRAGTAVSLIGSLQFLLATLASALMSLIDDGTAVPMALAMTLFATAGFVAYRWLAEQA